jgi:hypothetical protein
MPSRDLPGGTYRVADLELTRVGFGAMQLAGPGVFGPPQDRDAAIAVLRAAVDLGIRHISRGRLARPSPSPRGRPSARGVDTPVVQGTFPLGASGMARSRVPHALKIALAMAGATATIGVSPPPADG